MPVVSPHRSSASITGCYRSSLGSSSYYSSTVGRYPRYSYSERYTTTSYKDSDGQKTYSRSASITEDGITTRFREETREGSLRRDSISRDSGIGSIRENSVLETPTARQRDRDSSLTRSDAGRDRYTQLSVIDSVADLRNKYSPANYVPAIYRTREQQNISRSKSINDIGLPPIEKAAAAAEHRPNKKVKDAGVSSYNNSLGLTEFSNSTNNDNSMYISDDDNGNRPPVSEIRKRFETNNAAKTTFKDRTKKEEGESRRPLKLSKLENEEKSRGSELRINGIAIDCDKKAGKILDDSDVSTRQRKDDAKFDSSNNGVTGKQRNGDVSARNKFDSCQNGAVNGDVSQKDAALINGLDRWSKLTVSDRRDQLNNGFEIGGESKELSNGEEESAASAESVEAAAKRSNAAEVRNRSRVNNFSSYIPAKDYEKGDVAIGNGVSVDHGEEDDRSDMSNANRSRLHQEKNDLTASPRLNRTSVAQQHQQNASNSLSNNNNNNNNSATTSNNVGGHGGRSSFRDARDDEQRPNNSFERSVGRITASPVRHQGLNGLKNIGNTCFMNSVIQCLSNTKPLLEYLRRDSYMADINTSISSMKGALIKAFGQVIKELWSEDSSDRVVNTVSLKSQIQRFAPRFIGYAQQDAQEFLRYLLEGLHEDVNRVTTKPAPIHTEIDEKLSDAEKAAEAWQRYLRMDNSKIVDIFVGQLKSTLRCTYCGHCSVTFDPFWDLSLPIPQKVGPIRLQQCLDSFTREETLDGDEKPTCSKCKERRKCTKSFSIQKFPKILVIHLKRFSPTERFRGKLSVTVDFPLEGLDMSNYCSDNHTQCRYNLYAISNHSGTTYSGHYTAYCRHPYSSSWHEYNDSRVSSISPKSIVSGEAYVLFYELDGQKAHL